jgi:hypothetical protein
VEIYEFNDSEDSLSWKTEPNFESFGYDLAAYTEGIVSFSDEINKVYLSTFLLEFVLEVDLVLRRRCGLFNFETNASLQFSGDSVHFKRIDNLLEIRISGIDLTIKYFWSDFIDLFIALKKNVFSKIEFCYPNISKFKELEFIFLG